MPIFSHYEPLPDISAGLSITSLVFAIFTPVTVALRCAARFVPARNLGSDDWTIVASAAGALTLSVLFIVGCSWGFGKHASQLPPELVSKTLELFVAAQILYKVTIGLTKVSILLLYLRVFSIYQWFQRTCWVVLGIVIAFTTASSLVSIFQCHPVRFAFDKSANGGHGTCIDLRVLWYCDSVFNIASDFVIFFLPVLVVKSLQLEARSKVALCAVFAVGAFVCAVSIVRAQTINHSIFREDRTWRSVAVCTVTVAEVNVGILCANMPIFKRPLAMAFPWLFEKVTVRSNRYISESAGDVIGPSNLSKRRWEEITGQHAWDTKPGVTTTQVWHGGSSAARAGMPTEMDELPASRGCESRTSQDRILMVQTWQVEDTADRSGDERTERHKM